MADIFELFKRLERGTSSAETPKPVSFIVAGLGNPGDKYTNTRHNVGFRAADFIAAKLNSNVNNLRFNSLCTDCSLNGVRFLLMKPQTFMNSSGIAVREAASFYHIPPENILIIHDDISLEPGKMRIRRKGSAGGHNGLKSVIEQLNSDNFPRIKIGVGAKPPAWDLADWVLATFPPDDVKNVNLRIADTFPALSLIIAGDIDTAMGSFN